jgi:hypothetical protein
MTERRFPPPWTIEELSDACFVVSDASGQKLGYFYFEEEPGRRSAAKLLTNDEEGGSRPIRCVRFLSRSVTPNADYKKLT